MSTIFTNHPLRKHPSNFARDCEKTPAAERMREIPRTILFGQSAGTGILAGWSLFHVFAIIPLNISNFKVILGHT